MKSLALRCGAVLISKMPPRSQHRIILTLFLLSAVCAAQQTFITVSPTPVPAACTNELHILQGKLEEIGAPSQPWTWVVVCTEQAWDQIARTAQQNDQTCCAFTVLDLGYTYINGARLNDPLPTVTPGYLIAHELGHIATGSTKEKIADAWAKERGYKGPKTERPGRGSVEGEQSLKIPFEYASNRNSLVVRVRINDRPALLILDTGSAHTVLRPEAVGVPRSELTPARRSQPGAGFIGDAISKEVNLQIGERVLKRHQVVLMDLTDILAAYQENLDGVLGLDFLRQYSRIIVDLRERTIFLTR